MIQTTTLGTKPYKIQSKILLLIFMVFITASCAADAVAYKFVSIGPLIESGATIAFPITYLLADVVTEVYGYSTARTLIWLALACELIFALLVQGIILLPSPHNLNFKGDFTYVFGNMLRFVISGVVSDVISSFLNIYAISKWKLFLRGRLFWVRSIGSTALAELVQNIVTIGLAFTGVVTIHQVVKLTASAYLLELFYSFIFVWPGVLLIIILKRAEGVDAYDTNVNYNLFKLND